MSAATVTIRHNPEAGSACGAGPKQRSSAISIFHDFPRTPIAVRVQPARLRAAQNDLGLLRHVCSDMLEVIGLRLVHVVGELDVGRPQPPAFSDPDRKIAAALVGTPFSASAPLPYLAYHPGSGVGRIVNSFLAAKEPTTSLIPSFSAPVMLLINMAREGRGITWAPRSLVQADIECGRQVKAGTDDWDIEISICLFRARARITNAAESFWSAISKLRGRM